MGQITSKNIGIVIAAGVVGSHLILGKPRSLMMTVIIAGAALVVAGGVLSTFTSKNASGGGGINIGGSLGLQ